MGDKNLSEDGWMVHEQKHVWGGASSSRRGRWKRLRSWLRPGLRKIEKRQIKSILSAVSKWDYLLRIDGREDWGGREW